MGVSVRALLSCRGLRGCRGVRFVVSAMGVSVAVKIGGIEFVLEDQFGEGRSTWSTKKKLAEAVVFSNFKPNCSFNAACNVGPEVSAGRADGEGSGSGANSMTKSKYPFCPVRFTMIRLTPVSAESASPVRTFAISSMVSLRPPKRMVALVRNSPAAPHSCGHTPTSAARGSEAGDCDE